MALTQLKTGAIADDAVTGAKIADDTVAEANIANDAIGLTELKAGTDGQIITYDASGNPTAVGPGTDGQVLTSTGAGSPPAFESIPASGISDVVSDTSPQLGGDLDTNSFEISLDDSHAVKFGAGNDLKIQSDGSNSLLLSDLLYINNSANSENIAKFAANGAVELYYDNSKKFETSNDGATITGNLTLGDNNILKLGNDNDANIKHSGSDLFIENSTGGLNLKCSSGTGVGEGVITFTSGTGTERIRLQNDGHFRPSADNSYWLGTSSYRWANVYTADLNLSNEGSSNNFDGTWGSWSIQEGESDLFLKNNRSGKKYKFNLTEVT